MLKLGGSEQRLMRLPNGIGEGDGVGGEDLKVLRSEGMSLAERVEPGLQHFENGCPGGVGWGGQIHKNINAPQIRRLLEAEEAGGIAGKSRYRKADASKHLRLVDERSAVSGKSGRWS